jgi:hypothetical protein
MHPDVLDALGHKHSSLTVALQQQLQQSGLLLYLPDTLRSTADQLLAEAAAGTLSSATVDGHPWSVLFLAQAVLLFYVRVECVWPPGVFTSEVAADAAAPAADVTLAICAFVGRYAQQQQQLWSQQQQQQSRLMPAPLHGLVMLATTCHVLRRALVWRYMGRMDDGGFGTFSRAELMLQETPACWKGLGMLLLMAGYSLLIQQHKKLPGVNTKNSSSSSSSSSTLTSKASGSSQAALAAAAAAAAGGPGDVGPSSSAASCRKQGISSSSSTSSQAANQSTSSTAAAAAVAAAAAAPGAKKGLKGGFFSKDRPQNRSHMHSTAAGGGGPPAALADNPSSSSSSSSMVTPFQQDTVCMQILLKHLPSGMQEQGAEAWKCAARQLPRIPAAQQQLLQLLDLDPLMVLWLAGYEADQHSTAHLLGTVCTIRDCARIRRVQQQHGLSSHASSLQQQHQQQQQLVGMTLFVVYWVASMALSGDTVVSIGEQCARLCKSVLQPFMQSQQNAAVLPLQQQQQQQRQQQQQQKVQQQQLAYSKQQVLQECFKHLPGMLKRLLTAMHAHIPGSSSKTTIRSSKNLSNSANSSSSSPELETTPHGLAVLAQLTGLLLGAAGGWLPSSSGSGRSSRVQATRGPAAAACGSTAGRGQS